MGATHKFKTTNIKGKEYVEVNERIKFFRTDEAYNGWSMETDVVEHEGGAIMLRTVIRNSNGDIKATGLAREKEGDGFINKTSYIENCETSSWGRALGCLGIGIDTSIASSNEVNNAILQQKAKPTAIKKDKTIITKPIFEAMEKAITEGNREKVEEALDSYKDTELKEKIEDILKNS